MLYKNLILLIVLFVACKSQPKVQLREVLNLYPISKNGLWGFANEEGHIEIPYQFEKASFFFGDRASIKIEGKYGFINKQGEFQIKPKYDSIGYFNSREANVIYKGEKITINRKGKKLNKGMVSVGCGTGIEYASDPRDFFNKVADRYILNYSDFQNQKRLDPSSNYVLEDFSFDKVIPLSNKSMIVIKDGKYDIYVHYNSVGLKGIEADEILPNSINDKKDENLIQSSNAKFRVGEKWGIISDLGHIELEPEFYSIQKAYGIFYLVEYSLNRWGSMTLRKRFFR